MADQDWEQLQTFLSAARTGSFTQAARALGISQPTVSRRIEELERAWGATLFIRHSRGLRLTDRGAQLLAGTSGIDEQIQEVYRRGRSDRSDPQGTVRLSVNEPMAAYALAGTFSRVVEKFPQLQLELVVDNSAADLSRREADVAIRMFAPTQGDLIGKKLGEVTMGFYVSKDYLSKRSACGSSRGEKHRLIGMDIDPHWPKHLKNSGLSNSDFQLRTDSLLMHIRAAESGVGVAALHHQIGRQLGLVEVDLALPLPSYEVWLVRHEALRDDVCVRALCDELERGILAYLNEE